MGHIKLNKISNRKIAGKSQNIWRLINIFPNNTWIKEDVSSEIKNIFELNKKGIQLIRIGGDAAETVLKGKIIALNVYVRKEERFNIN